MQARQDTRRDSDFSVREFLKKHRVEFDVNCSHLLQYIRSLPGFHYLTVYDFETSGLGKEAEIVEVGMMVFDKRKDRPICFSGLVNPGKPICLSATEVHGITDSDVRGSPKWSTPGDPSSPISFWT